MGKGQIMSGKMEHQMISKRFLQLDTVGASAMCEGSLFHGPAERTTKAAFRLTRGKCGWWTLKLCLQRLPAAGGSKNAPADKVR